MAAEDHQYRQRTREKRPGGGFRNDSQSARGQHETVVRAPLVAGPCVEAVKHKAQGADGYDAEVAGEGVEVEEIVGAGLRSRDKVPSTRSATESISCWYYS